MLARSAVLIGLVAPGDAVSFSNGGGSNFPPSLVITQSTSQLLQSTLAIYGGQRHDQS